MLGDFITRGLLLVLGYAYPAFECFKTVEKNRVEIEELRFWCQYWIIVAALTVFERIGDIFISWLPMYGEMKLALFTYLWYPKTKGTGYVYETLLKPSIAKHEPDIDRNLQELRARAWDLALSYWQNCTKLGQTTFFQTIQYLAAQSGKFSKTNNEEKNENPYPRAAAPLSSPTGSPSFHPMAHKLKQLSQLSDRRRPPLPLVSPSRSVAQPPKSEAVHMHLHDQAEFKHSHEEAELGDSTCGSGLTDESEVGVEHRLNAAWLRLRHSKGFH